MKVDLPLENCPLEKFPKSTIRFVEVCRKLVEYQHGEEWECPYFMNPAAFERDFAEYLAVKRDDERWFNEEYEAARIQPWDCYPCAVKAAHENLRKRTAIAAGESEYLGDAHLQEEP